MTVTLYHNPQCSTSRKTLELIREAGIEPVVVDYRHAGWTKSLLKPLFKAMKATPRDLLRVNGTPAEELGLTDPAVSEKGTILARPQERVLEIL